MDAARAQGATGMEREGSVTKMIESQTARVPSGTYFSAAVMSMAVSAGLMLMGQRHAAMFVGQWAPSLLIIGLYNKVVKLQGSEHAV